MPLKKSDILNIFNSFAAENPNPVTELVAQNPYCLLVAIVLSAQATDVGVNKATPALFAIADTPQKMVALGEGGIKNHIKTIGLFNAKAKNILALSQMLLADSGGQVPTTRDALERLPGAPSASADASADALSSEEGAYAELQLSDAARFYPSDAALARWRSQADAGRAVIAYDVMEHRLVRQTPV